MVLFLCTHILVYILNKCLYFIKSFVLFPAFLQFYIAFNYRIFWVPQSCFLYSIYMFLHFSDSFNLCILLCDLATSTHLIVVSKSTVLTSETSFQHFMSWRNLFVTYVLLAYVLASVSNFCRISYVISHFPHSFCSVCFLVPLKVWILWCILAVSYTYLDVYKRQHEKKAFSG